MILNHTPLGIALLCDKQGVIQFVIQDGIGIDGLETGRLFEKLVDSGSRIKFLNFLVETRSKGAAFDWEINILNGNKTITLRLAGVDNNDSLMLIGARNSKDALDLCDELTKVNSEQAMVLRNAIKTQMQVYQNKSDDDAGLFDEISRLNNDLVTLQRDLAKKNFEIEKLYAEVQKQAISDPLTGLYNRRGFFEMGDREIERSKRFGRPLAVICFDIDHFKTINDTHGHAVGDQYLQKTVLLCTQQIRKVDIFGRLGGDEFSLILPETKREHAFDVAERLRIAIDKSMEDDLFHLKITLSLGVAVLKESTVDLNDLLLCADRALYQAKDAGRNCTRFELD